MYSIGALEQGAFEHILVFQNESNQAFKQSRRQTIFTHVTRETPGYGETNRTHRINSGNTQMRHQEHTGNTPKPQVEHTWNTQEQGTRLLVVDALRKPRYRTGVTCGALRRQGES